MHGGYKKKEAPQTVLPFLGYFHTNHRFLAARARLCLAFHAFTFSHKNVGSMFTIILNLDVFIAPIHVLRIIKANH